MRACQSFTLARGSALQLAALRIAVAGTVLLLPEVRDARALASVAPALRVAPEGLGWFVAHVPIGPTIATIVQATCVASALCAAVGFVARPALGALTLSAFYLLALGQLSGAVWHDMHVLWMAALLTASPCDEALAFDRRSAPGDSDPVRYALPLLFARLLLACVYFFPGLHKLGTSGLAWALSDNLRNQLWWKWAEYGVVPAVRVDRYPFVLQAAGLGVMAFELSFPLFAVTRRGQPWAAGLGLAFHGLTQLVLGIPFPSLWLLYVVFIDPETVYARWRTPTAARPDPTVPIRWKARRWPRPTLITGLALLLPVAAEGARGQTRAYPFACYPTFEWVAGTEMPDLVIEAESPDGARTVVPHARSARGRRSQRQWGEIWSLAGATSPVDPARLRAYLATVSRQEPARSALRAATEVRFYRGFVSVVPEDRARVRRGPLLAEMRLVGEGDAAGQ